MPFRGRIHWLWRAVEGNCDVLDIFVQPRRNKSAAMRSFKKLFKNRGQPYVIFTDKLGSYGGERKNGPAQVTLSGATVLVGPRSNLRPVPPQTQPSFSLFLSPLTSGYLHSLG
ncbi:DDE-type integrase/transposase/recombinase [Ruegeria sp. A3M17]|uniref:DDE-type integrase/transposase/recombinase n=1 Tax=Ruegeria sp. A3M17 TaxID=2267229 RepID=UPI003512DC8F